MKIAKIEYERCAEWSGSAYVWIPDEWTEDEFDAAVHESAVAYLAYLKEFDADADAPPKAFQPPWDEFPNHTVAAVQQIWAERKAARSAWEEERSKSRRGFPAFLADVGIWALDSQDPDLVAHVDWGHRHGVRLDYEPEPTVSRRIRFE